MFNVEYKVVSEEELVGYEPSEWDDPQDVVVRVDRTGISEHAEITVVGHDGSCDSPEDNYLFRQYSFVAPALNEAYQLGFRHGSGEL